MSDKPTIPVDTRALVMSRYDRGRLHFALGRPVPIEGEAIPDMLAGLELRVNPFLQDGIMAAVDARGNVLCLLDLRGDHDVTRDTPPYPETNQ